MIPTEFQKTALIHLIKEYLGDEKFPVDNLGSSVKIAVSSQQFPASFVDGESWMLSSPYANEAHLRYSVSAFNERIGQIRGWKPNPRGY